MKPIEKPLDVPESVRLLNATLAQWRGALAEGLDLADKSMVELLKDDLDRMAQAVQVIGD